MCTVPINQHAVMEGETMPFGHQVWYVGLHVRVVASNFDIVRILGKRAVFVAKGRNDRRCDEEAEYAAAPGRGWHIS